MGHCKAQIEKTIQATERMLSALKEEESQAIELAQGNLAILVRQNQQHLRDVFCSLGASEQEALKPALQRLSELTKLCMERAESEKKGVNQALDQIREIRIALKATQNVTPPAESTFETSA